MPSGSAGVSLSAASAAAATRALGVQPVCSRPLAPLAAAAARRQGCFVIRGATAYFVTPDASVLQDPDGGLCISGVMAQTMTPAMVAAIAAQDNAGGAVMPRQMYCIEADGRVSAVGYVKPTAEAQSAATNATRDALLAAASRQHHVSYNPRVGSIGMMHGAVSTASFAPRPRVIPGINYGAPPVPLVAGIHALDHESVRCGSFGATGDVQSRVRRDINGGTYGRMFNGVHTLSGLGSGVSGGLLAPASRLGVRAPIPVPMEHAHGATYGVGAPPPLSSPHVAYGVHAAPAMPAPRDSGMRAHTSAWLGSDVAAPVRAGSGVRAAAGAPAAEGATLARVDKTESGRKHNDLQMAGQHCEKG
jgi:hypothetical protein